MEYQIVKYPGGYHVTRYNPKTMQSETIGDFDRFETAQEYKAFLEGASNEGDQ